MFNSVKQALARLVVILDEETRGLRPSVAMYRWTNTLSRHSQGDARAGLLRKTGLTVGADTSIGVDYRITGRAPRMTLFIGARCELGANLVLDLEERIDIGDGVQIGDGTMILTSSHELAGKEHRAGPVQRAPVRIESEAKIGPRAILLPGITIGQGAIVEAGAVVGKEVPAHSRVRGNPAAVVREPEAAGATP